MTLTHNEWEAYEIERKNAKEARRKRNAEYSTKQKAAIAGEKFRKKYRVRKPEANKLNPSEDIDPSNAWVSVDALMLIGLLLCPGTNLEKAKCFYMIVQP